MGGRERKKKTPDSKEKKEERADWAARGRARNASEGKNPNPQNPTFFGLRVFCTSGEG